MFFQMAMPIRALSSLHRQSQLFSPHRSQLKGYIIDQMDHIKKIPACDL